MRATMVEPRIEIALNHLVARKCPLDKWCTFSRSRWGTGRQGSCSRRRTTAAKIGTQRDERDGAERPRKQTNLHRVASFGSLYLVGDARVGRIDCMPERFARAIVSKPGIWPHVHSE